jgi:hypothetical protein
MFSEPAVAFICKRNMTFWRCDLDLLQNFVLKEFKANKLPQKQKQTNLVACSPQANYTDRATAAFAEVSANFCW